MGNDICLVCNKKAKKFWFTVEYERIICEDCVELIITNKVKTEEAEVIRHEFKELLED